ncbi:hypothetical protein [Delftia sp. Cs1-4]|uniref:hypothetical protein n=1 Tax=Delftia sp. (strain Cs1-4) TaxID=742013 RepID=UPI0012F50E1D|nr:hypothetical protein [Delftia sp. Cs1-4]
MLKSQQTLAAIALAFAATGPVSAQVRCTMPNQKVITLQTASKCPADALKAETLDGKDITPPQSERRTPAPRPTIVAPAPPTPKPIENHIVRPRQEEYREPFDVARNICTVVKDGKVGICSIDQARRPGDLPNIRVVSDGTTAELRQLCQMLAKMGNELSKGSMRNNNWEVKVFSRHDFFTPVETCRV